MNWNNYPNFSKSEFDCKHTGKNEMKPEFMEKLQELRILYGKPMKISSGFRDVTHPVEAKKSKGGYHTLGIACDVACGSVEAYEIIRLAMQVGFKGIGVNQKGEGRFIHLDLRDTGLVYSY